MKMYENEQRKNGMHFLQHWFPALDIYISEWRNANFNSSTGQPVKHEFVKEALIGLAAAEADKLAETKGEEWCREHKQKTREQAQQQATQLYDDHYGNGNDYDP